MSDAYVIAVDGLSVLRDLQTIPNEVKRAALQALNKTLSRTRTSSARVMREQVNFPARYLSGEDGRLAITKKATSGDLEGVITGRERPTSLARFLASGSVGGKNGVSVQVAPGMARRSKRMFLVRLRAGNADLDTKSNLGLAIRLKPGERVEGKHKMVKFGKGLYLLFGPSVAQVFASVADDEAPGAAAFLETEFLRIMDLN